MGYQSSLTRRAFLRSGTAAITLPFLESFGFKAFAATPKIIAPPKRMIFLGIGYGVTAAEWFPKKSEVGKNYKLPRGLAPMARHKSDFSIIQQTANENSADAHWGSTFWLTGANRYAEPGKSFHNTVSVDQVAAEALGRQTRYTSLQLNGSDPALDGPGHGPGLSLSWDKGGKPVAGLSDPLVLFHKLFSPSKMSLAERKAHIAQERSILDTILSDAKSMQRKLNKTDVDKLDEYFQGIREMEISLGKDEAWLTRTKPTAPFTAPENRPYGYDEVKLMYKLIIAAMQTDSTRVATYRQPIGALLSSIGASSKPHDMSHYSPSGPRIESSRLRDQKQSELLAGLLDDMKKVQESDGSRLLDNTNLVFGSNLHSVHTLNNCTTLVAGGGSGLKLGENIVLPDKTPLCNLWLTMLQGAGIKADKHGDSTGVLNQVQA